MRSTIVAISFAAVSLAQAVSEFTDGQPQATTYTNPFTSYLTQTNSLGVVTGQPPVETSIASVVTSQASVITSQAAPETSQTAAASFVSGSPGIPATVMVASSSIIPILGSPPVVSTFASASGFTTVPAGANATVSTQTAPSVTTGSASGTASGSATGSTGSGSTGTTAGASTSPSSTSRSGAVSMVQPVLGLGFAAAFFATFL